MEDAVYVCSWNRSSDGFTLWVKSRPKIRSEGATYEEAERRLIDTIQNAGGAMCAVLEFDPPLPKSPTGEKYSTPAIVHIGGDEGFVTTEPRRIPFESPTEAEARFRLCDTYYQAPICRKCRNATAPRSDKPLMLEYAIGKYDGAFGSVANDAGGRHEIVSEDFLSLLTSDEKRYLLLRPVACKGRKRFFEIIGPSGPSLMAIAGLELSGWQCGECGYQVWGHDSMHMDYYKFVAKSDLPSLLPGIFTVGAAPNIQLAATAARWKELVGHKGTKGFVSLSIGVVPDEEVVQRPELPIR